MATCLAHNFRNCSIKSATCASCCAQSVSCKLFYIDHLVGSANNLQVGDKIHQDSKCGVVADIGIYTDCGPDGSCDQPIEGDKIYGCVTVGSGGLVTAIAACSGEVTCGSGAGSNCLQSSTLDTEPQHNWPGRQKKKVSALDTWETLYESTTGWDVSITNVDTGTTCYTSNTIKKECYIKQIYIQNCDNGSTNDKKFSVRIYNALTGTIAVSDCTINTTNIPAEMSLADRIKLSDNERIKLLDHESPLKLNTHDVVQIQSHTSLVGWVISGWFEEISQNWDEPMSPAGTITGANEGVGIVGAMQGLSAKLGKRKTDRRMKPGAASTSGDG